MMNKALSKPENVEQLDAEAGCPALPCSLPEVVPDPAGMGRGWTAIRCGEDDRGPYEEWIGNFWETYAEAKQAANHWNE
jgi:hypothetical protein